VEIILTHQNADFDAIASMLGAYKLNPEAVPILPSRQHASVREFLALYRNGLPFIAWHDFKAHEKITHITLTDTYNRLEIAGVATDTPTVIIEHHTLERRLKPYETFISEAVGAATTLLVERIREQKIKLNTLEATLMALGIYADTGMFTYGGTTNRDMYAASWLLQQGADLDTVRRFLSSPLNPEQQALFELLIETADNRQLMGYGITVCSAISETQIGSLTSVTTALREILDSTAIFLLVAMPNHIQLVCRSTHDAINVGELAQHFGGGGHPRAAAAAIYKGEITMIVSQIWDYLKEHIRPAVRIADLMSYGVLTVEADEKIIDLIPRLRRIGHEGYPVLEKGEVIGLLTLRDADKTLEHGLKEAKVREVMLGGNYTLSLDDPVSRLEEIMVDTDWGQIPVIDHQQQLLGIVTRTDLIKHWGQTHPTITPDPPRIDVNSARFILGKHNIALIELIAEFAQQQNIALYMVGGVVRDLLLERPNFDIDFVVEGSAIEFAQTLCNSFGGRIHPYHPFRTAKWRLDEEVAQKLGLPLAEIPDHLDFATTRSELYEHPTALPTVYNSGIKLDLRRRDFTINTLAVQLSPQHSMWRILDFYSGMADLETRLIRVLHSLSFVDDPTRILRAVRFSERLRFTIDPRTTELIQLALPMLRRITGERLQNELTLLLKEENAVRGLLKLEALGALPSIHPDFHVRPEIQAPFEQAKVDYPAWIEDEVLLKWYLVLAQIPYEKVVKVARRLLFGMNKAKGMQATAKLVQDSEILTRQTARPSEIDAHLSGLSTESLVTAWLWFDDAQIRQRIENYYQVWQHIRPTINGNTLSKMGLEPGPEYRKILENLRIAWLDGKVSNEADEQVLLKQLIHEVYDDRTR
jgi:tRNA nucleotidyltransferase (CCA-adding enzyme)